MNPLHYPDLERCKKLTEIGFPETDGFQNTFDEKTGDFIMTIRLPTVMEMLDVIPDAIRPPGKMFELVIHPDKFSSFHNAYACYYVGDVTKPYTEENVPVYCSHTTLPNALADLIIWLVENNHLTLGKN